MSAAGSREPPLAIAGMAVGLSLLIVGFLASPRPARSGW